MQYTMPMTGTYTMPMLFVGACHVQGMIKDMHVGLGSLHRRMDAFEAGGGSGGAADPASLKELRVRHTRAAHCRSSYLLRPC